MKYVNLGCHNIQLGHLYIQTALAGLGVSRFELSCFTNGMNFKFGTCSKLEDHLGKLFLLVFLRKQHIHIHGRSSSWTLLGGSVRWHHIFYEVDKIYKYGSNFKICTCSAKCRLDRQCRLRAQDGQGMVQVNRIRCLPSEEVSVFCQHISIYIEY